jgi:L-ascorbate metabolism protein UlaG (beta-lactamase superfamily)
VTRADPKARYSPNSHAGRVTFVGHSTLLIEIDGVRLLTDPVLRDRVGPLRRQTPSVEPELYQGVDAVLISHLHWDHLDFPSLRKLDDSVTLIVPRGARDAIRRKRFRNVEELAVGESIDVGPVAVAATPAVHSGLPNTVAADADTVGFTVTGSQRIYFAGDTDLFDGMGHLGDGLDAALLPVWGWGPVLGSGHLDPERAAGALRLLKPRIAVPIHWGTLAPIGLGRAPRKDWLHKPPREFARQAARLAPGVDVRLLEPGSSTELA